MFKRIVQRTRDGKYAIKRWRWFGGWEYMSIDSCFWWSTKRYIDLYCWTDNYDLISRLFDTEEEIVIKTK